MESQVASALWTLSEGFYARGDFPKSVKCLEAICQSSASFLPLVEVKARVKVASLLLQHTDCIQEARQHLERAQVLLKQLPSQLPLRCHTHVQLARCYAMLGQARLERQALKAGLAAVTEARTQTHVTAEESQRLHERCCQFQLLLASALSRDNNPAGALDCLRSALGACQERKARRADASGDAAMVEMLWEVLLNLASAQLHLRAGSEGGAAATQAALETCLDLDTELNQAPLPPTLEPLRLHLRAHFQLLVLAWEAACGHQVPLASLENMLASVAAASVAAGDARWCAGEGRDAAGAAPAGNAVTGAAVQTAGGQVRAGVGEGTDLAGPAGCSGNGAASGASHPLAIELDRWGQAAAGSCRDVASGIGAVMSLPPDGHGAWLPLGAIPQPWEGYCLLPWPAAGALVHLLWASTLREGSYLKACVTHYEKALHIVDAELEVIASGHRQMRSAAKGTAAQLPPQGLPSGAQDGSSAGPSPVTSAKRAADITESSLTPRQLWEALPFARLRFHALEGLALVNMARTDVAAAAKWAAMALEWAACSFPTTLGGVQAGREGAANGGVGGVGGVGGGGASGSSGGNLAAAAHALAGHLALSAGRGADAVQQFRLALQRAATPTDTVLLSSNLALAMLAEGTEAAYGSAMDVLAPLLPIVEEAASAGSSHTDLQKAAVWFAAGVQAVMQGRHEDARSHLKHALRVGHHKLGNHQLIAQVMTQMGRVNLALGDLEGADHLLKGGQALANSCRDLYSQVEAAAAMAELHHRCERPEPELKCLELSERRQDELDKRVAEAARQPELGRVVALWQWQRGQCICRVFSSLRSCLAVCFA
eukprot:jgi/Mesvir1/22642/Mv14077-RA.1